MKKPVGTYDVVRASSYKCGWKLRHFKMVDGKRVTEIVPQAAWLALGFTVTMTFEEARTRVQQMNLERREDREVARASAVRALRLVTTEERLLPQAYVDEFAKVALNYDSLDETAKIKATSTWKYVAAMIKEVNIRPQDYAERADAIFGYIARKRTSVEYTKAILKVLNQWGRFLAKRQGFFYDPVTFKAGPLRNRVAERYEEGPTFVGKSDPLAPAALAAKREKFPPAQYRWLELTVWFGLRPKEADSLRKPNKNRWFISMHEDSETPILNVFQTKLVYNRREDRWKAIPCFTKEQRRLVRELQDGEPIQRPTYKRMHTVFDSGRITLYGGRQGFEELMRGLGQDFYDISSWMGHQTVDTTWAKYRNRKRVSFKKPEAG
jgi:hypothetical protein